MSIPFVFALLLVGGLAVIGLVVVVVLVLTLVRSPNPAPVSASEPASAPVEG